MEIKQTNNNLQINPIKNKNLILSKKGILLDNLSLLTKMETIFIIDLYHICTEKSNKTDLDMIKYFEIVNEYSIYNENYLYIFLHSNKQSELIEETIHLNDFTQKNIFLEDKISNISFISGFCVARNIPVFIFTDALHQIGNWIKIKDSTYEKSIKASELDYFRISLDYMLKDKKRKYEFDLVKSNKSKLSKILEESNNEKTNNTNNANKNNNEIKPTLKNLLNGQIDNKMNNNAKEKTEFINKKRNNATSNYNNGNIINKNSNINLSNANNSNNALETQKTRKSEIDEYITSYKFMNFLNKIKKYISLSPPKNFEVLKNIIYHFTEQNIISINNNLKETSTSNKNELIKPEELSFCILKELLKSEFILSKKLCDLINTNIASNLNEISSILNFHININNNYNLTDKDNEKTGESMKHAQSNEKDSIINISNNNTEKNIISIGDDSEEEYSRLIKTCHSICLFVKNVICKILNSINLSCLEKLPINPYKYRNYVFAFVNNQELYKLSKKILNIDYNRIVNVITDGIIIEFMKNSLIVLINDKKIHYNLPEIEKEKFRLIKSKNNEEAKLQEN